MSAGRELPVLPTDPKVIDLGENNAPRTCDVCRDDADHYVIVTCDMANRRLDTDLGYDEWLVNSMLCSECFSEAPRVESWEELDPV